LKYIEELLERKSSGSSLEKNPKNTAIRIRNTDHTTLYLQKLALPLPRSSDRAVGIVHSQTQATTFRSLYDENDNDSDTESANSKSHSREPLTHKLFSESNAQPNNRCNESKDGRIINSVDSRGKDVNIYDDNSCC
jgi:hypothetical protein